MRPKRTRPLRGLGVAALVLALCTYAGPALAATLKIAVVVPDGTAWMNAMRAGADEIESRTEGRVVIKFYPGGVMGDAQSVLRKMRVGQLHGGAFTVGGVSDVYRDAEVYSLPFMFRSYDEVDYVRARMDPLLREGFAEAGLVALAISEGGFANLMSIEPVRNVSDLTHMRVWAEEDDQVSQVAWQVAGIAPVTLSLADVFTGLQTGLIDAVAGPPVGAIAFQWHTKLRYVTDVPLSYITGVLAVDARAFGKLAPEDREVVREVIGRISRELDADMRESDRQAREALRSEGLEFVEPSPEELTRWRAIAGTTVERVQAEGTYSAEMLTRLAELLEEYRGSVAPPASTEPAP